MARRGNSNVKRELTSSFLSFSLQQRFPALYCATPFLVRMRNLTNADSDTHGGSHAFS